MGRWMTRAAAPAACLALVVCMSAFPATHAAAAAWTKLSGAGITDPNNQALLPGHILEGKLTVGAASIGGNPVSMYTYDTAFHKLYQTGFGSQNTRLMPWGRYHGEIYVGTENSTTGGELWKWNGSGDPTLVRGNGWGVGAANFQVNPVAVFNDEFLVSVSNNNGLSLYKFDGTDWTQLVGQGAAGTPTGPGFGNAHNTLIDSGESRELGGRLILPVANNTDGVQVYSFDGTGFTRIAQPGPGLWPSTHKTGYAATSFADNRLYMSTGNYFGPVADLVQLWSYDGIQWTQVALSGGLENAQNFLLQPFVRGNDLFVTAWNASEGCRVYRRTGNSFSAFSDKGFDTTNHNWTCLLASYNGMLFGLTGNLFTGGEAWSTAIGPSIDQLVPDSGPYGTIVSVQGHDFGISQGASHLTFGDVEATQILSWSDVEITVVVEPRLPAGPVKVHTPRGDSNEVTFTPTLSKTWYFAEGTTRDNELDGKYDEWISIQNPGSTAAGVTLTYMLADGANPQQQLTVPAKSRSTVSVNSFLGADRDVSTLVESDQLVLAERPMYFNYHWIWTGGHDVIGVPVPRTTYYFAEGTTRSNADDGSFEEWLCIQNPGPVDATVNVDYVLGTGESILKTYPVGARSRHTVSVNAEVGPDQDVSAVVTCTEPIVVERPMYFNYHNKWTGGHNVVGAPGPDTVFYFAEGSTRDNAADGSFEEWICLQNATGGDTTANITYYTDRAGTQTQQVEVKANSRRTVDVRERLGVDVDASFMITSEVPILAERPMYFNYQNAWDGGHDVMGCAAPSGNFYFAEGTTQSGFVTYLAIMNTGDVEANVTFHYMLGDGSERQATATLQPKVRYTRNVTADVGVDQDVSTWVESNGKIVVERPMYFDYQGWATGGSNTLGYGL